MRRVSGRFSMVVAWIVVIVAAIHPPHGLGVNVCWARATAGVPCPGCGLTRSISCVVRGDLASSIQYHALGPLVLLVMTTIAACSLLPPRTRRRCLRAGLRHSRIVGTAYVVAVVAFVAYGVGRALLHIV